MPDAPTPDRKERLFLFGLLGALAFAAFLVFRPYAGWVLFALFIGYAFYPVRDRLVARRVPRWLAAGALTVVVTALVIAPFAFIAWQLADDVSAAAAMIEARGPDFFLRRIADAVGVPAGVAQQGVGALQGALASVASQSVSIVGDVAIGSVLAVFLLYSIFADGDRLVAWTRENLPMSEGRRNHLFKETRRALDAVLLGVIAVAVAQGIVAGVGWWLFGLPEPLFWGFVLVIASLVPYVGAHVVLFPAGAWLAAQGRVAGGVGLILFSMFVVGTVDNVLRPIFIGKKGGIHPGLVLVGVVGGVPAFGAIGILLGPVVLALLVAVVQVVRHPAAAERAGREEEQQEAIGNAARMLAAHERAEMTRALDGADDADDADEDARDPRGTGRPS